MGRALCGVKRQHENSLTGGKTQCAMYTTWAYRRYRSDCIAARTWDQRHEDSSLPPLTNPADQKCFGQNMLLFSRLVRARNACPVDENPTCSVSAFCRDARVYGHTTSPMHANEYTSSPLPSAIAARALPNIVLFLPECSLYP